MASVDYNKAGYTAQDAPSTRLKITWDRRTYGRTDTPSYRDATAHLKKEISVFFSLFLSEVYKSAIRLN